MNASISLWQVMAVGSTGFAQVRDAGLSVAANGEETRAVDIFLGGLEEDGFPVGTLRPEMTRFLTLLGGSDKVLADHQADWVADALQSVPSESYALAVAKTVRHIPALVLFERSGTEPLLLQRLHSTLNPYLYQAARHPDRDIGSASISQLVFEAAMRRDEAALNFLKQLSVTHAERFLSFHCLGLNLLRDVAGLPASFEEGVWYVLTSIENTADDDDRDLPPLGLDMGRAPRGSGEEE
ncbi:MAG: hypothetical protein Q7T03_11135 [Deltaproteobacteria bacterium]|nr:hypothetical protein [Deltaproteobacteria bacterium]